MTDADGKIPGTTKLNAEQKAATTHDAAMQIIDAEVAAREKKTERLRQLRLEQEANRPAGAEAPARSRRKKT